MSLPHEMSVPEASGVTVAVTVLNEAEDIASLVTSLMQQTLVPERVVVVDGGSSDGTWEWLLAAAKRWPTLEAIRDESCNLRRSPGPIARGRNVGVRHASSAVVACADAGCIYPPDWLERLSAPLREGEARYALGGSCLHPSERTVWDIASAPFFGVKLDAAAPTKSCTARSMAFRKDLWTEAGEFPETVFLGEDTLFDGAVRKLVRPAFPIGAKALYRPRHTFGSAVHQLAMYAQADGMLGVRPARLARNLARCLVELLALVVVGATLLPLLAIFMLELFFAFRLDWRELRRASPGALVARLVFSLVVPWVVAWNQVAGGLRKTVRPNRQNAL